MGTFTNKVNVSSKCSKIIISPALSIFVMTILTQLLILPLSTFAAEESLFAQDIVSFQPPVDPELGPPIRSELAANNDVFIFPSMQMNMLALVSLL